MLHPEKPYLSLLHCIFKIVQEITHYRADEIKPQPYYKLYMCDGSAYPAHTFAEPGIGFIA